MHAILPSIMLREFVAGSGKAWTWLKNSMGTMEKLSFLLHVLSITCTPYAVLTMGLAGEFTAFMVPFSLVTLGPRCLASSSKIKLCIASVSSNVQMAWPLMDTLT